MTWWKKKNGIVTPNKPPMVGLEKGEEEGEERKRCNDEGECMINT